MEYKELKKKETKDLHKLLAEKRNELRELRFKDANKQLKDVRAIRKIKTLIAQTITLVNKRNRGEERAAAKAESGQQS